MPTNEHFYEAKVVRNTDYINTVEAAMLWVAYEVWQDETRPDNERRLAFNLFMVPGETARHAQFFARIVIFNPTLRGQVFVPPATITPQNMDETALRNAIRAAWTVAANPPITPDEEPA